MALKFLFFNIFLSTLTAGCQSKAKELQREKISSFFEELLLEHGGAYTLFGSKPITMEPLVNYTQDELEKINRYIEQHPEIPVLFVDRKLEEGWEEWKKTFPAAHFENYILTELQVKDHKMVVFANTKNTLSLLMHHYDFFKEVVGCEFDPVDAIQQLREQRGDFWQKMLSHHTAKGLLFGYGLRNATLFEKQIRKEINCTPVPSEDRLRKGKCCLNGKPLLLPTFAMFDQEESAELLARYGGEREKIRKYYAKKDFLEATLVQLRKSPCTPH